MGKGDKKTRRGKIKNKTYGNIRPNPKKLKNKKKQQQNKKNNINQ
ncbi:30S ribosomal protein THX [Blattabacterium cuenoti]|nr:30S ribosomal protein THX [Blattabacterium cuenoti]